jgi:luciferase family oxidoreductase group 1
LSGINRIQPGLSVIPFSVLDLSPIRQGDTPAQALANSLDLARHAEQWGYLRFWLAEHHNMPGIASAATAVVIAHVAGGTHSIRVGSGGVMLPNHAPLIIAEQFGTLAALFPGRIDLGLGRAPGTDQTTARALRRNLAAGAETFPADVAELQRLLGPEQPGDSVRAVPGTGSEVPIWLLGSSLYSAELAAAMGLPFAFASHFAPAALFEALDLYHRNFRPSARLERPYAMAALSVIAAETDDEARRLFTSLQQQFINLRRGMPTQLQPPIDNPAWQPWELAMMSEILAYAIVGSREVVRERLREFLRVTGIDELMVTAQIYDHQARLRSFEMVSQVREELAREDPVPG